MNKLEFEPGSFRDPAGRIFYDGDEVYRELSETGIKRFTFLKKNNLINELINEKFLISTKECDKKSNENYKIDQNKILLKHEKINFISYPYEWTFTQLKDAAIFHLDLQIYLLTKNAKLIDASAYNIQFKNNKPIFIDVLSIDEYKQGEYWYAHKQFCENFLNPLVLSAKKGVSFNNLYRGNLEGVYTHEIAPLLSIKDFLSPTLFFHIYLLNKLEEKSKIDPKKTNNKISALKKFTKKSYHNILKQLKNYIQGLDNKKTISNWDKYSEKNTYNPKEEEKKLEIIKSFIDNNNPNFLGDLGCNEGKYSEYASSQKKIKVVGVDFDLNVLDRAYIKSKKNNLNFFPIYADFSNPSNDLGWNEVERKSFFKRSKFDAIIALALIHHLVIAKNIPLDQVLRWLVSLAPVGLIEFVPKKDPTSQIMLKLKGDIFPEYTEKNFTDRLSQIADIKKITLVTDTERKIYEYSIK
ncbi:MAG: class I SAM-dependent methyltransferase [Candidatus Pelagibacter sp.]